MLSRTEEEEVEEEELKEMRRGCFSLIAYLILSLLPYLLLSSITADEKIASDRRI